MNGRTICWTHGGAGLEHLLLSERTADSVVLAIDDKQGPFRLAYRLTWDEAWRVREADLQVAVGNTERTLGLRSDGLDGSGFRVDLPVDEDGIVLDYPELFRRVIE